MVLKFSWPWSINMSRVTMGFSIFKRSRMKWSREGYCHIFTSLKYSKYMGLSKLVALFEIGLYLLNNDQLEDKAEYYPSLYFLT